MDADIVLRRASKEDIQAIISLQTKIFHDEQGIPVEIIAEFMERTPQCWCAFMDNALAGAIAAWEENGQTHLGRFVTKADCRGLHIGTRLVHFCLEDLFSQGNEMIYMEARDITVKIMCKMGGKTVGEPVPFYKGTVTPMVLCREEYHK